MTRQTHIDNVFTMREYFNCSHLLIVMNIKYFYNLYHNYYSSMQTNSIILNENSFHPYFIKIFYPHISNALLIK